MKSNFLFNCLSFGVAVGAFVSVVSPQSAAAAGKTANVVMKSISYDPKQLEISIGDSVVWENKSHTEHSATADEGKTFDTGLVAPDKSSKPVLFTKAGRYEYHCSIHGKSMSAFVTVKGN